MGWGGGVFWGVWVCKNWLAIFVRSKTLLAGGRGEQNKTCGCGTTECEGRSGIGDRGGGRPPWPYLVVAAGVVAPPGSILKGRRGEGGNGDSLRGGGGGAGRGSNSGGQGGNCEEGLEGADGSGVGGVGGHEGEVSLWRRGVGSMRGVEGEVEAKS